MSRPDTKTNNKKIYIITTCWPTKKCNLLGHLNSNDLELSTCKNSRYNDYSNSRNTPRLNCQIERFLPLLKRLWITNFLIELIVKYTIKNVIFFFYQIIVFFYIYTFKLDEMNRFRVYESQNEIFTISKTKVKEIIQQLVSITMTHINF